MKLETVSLKKNPTLTEKWVQDQIADTPSILGLGDLTLRDKERIQPNAGRLDLLLQDPETLKRYEVEIQLGATDETHIIRTIEYWDIERKRYPQYEHAAVIVAEDITSRFLNVIQLFNGAVPLIALKVTAYKVGAEYALTFVKVIDEMVYGLVDGDEPVAEPTDKAYWETKRGTKTTLALTDELMQIVKEVEPKAELKYNKYYIGLSVDKAPRTFITFTPAKAHVIMAIKLSKTKEVDEQLDEAELNTLKYDGAWKQYRIKVGSMVEGKQRETLLDLTRQSKDYTGGGKKAD